MRPAIRPSRPRRTGGLAIRRSSPRTRPSRSGRPRSAAVELAIIDATLSLLVEVGPDGFSVATVSERAGVGKATIYRRWRTKDELLLAAIRSLRGTMPEPPDSSDLREALLQCLKGMQRMHDDPRYVHLAAHLCGAADTHAELYAEYMDQAIRPRRDIARAVVQRGLAAGLLNRDADPEIVLDLLFGPVLIRCMGASGIRGTPEQAEVDPEALVDHVLRGLLPR
ncbi:TetR/AcrR family transcriptional regulator [Streptomyces sp. NPDC005760]|uniref:TetR/AcrR family transcriptional regulator n=1 Tax=Streptomyces sp. NPDC005760 TaxID=3156718 RepID=UPI0034069523